MPYSDKEKHYKRCEENRKKKYQELRLWKSVRGLTRLNLTAEEKELVSALSIEECLVWAKNRKILLAEARRTRRLEKYVPRPRRLLTEEEKRVRARVSKKLYRLKNKHRQKSEDCRRRERAHTRRLCKKNNDPKQVSFERFMHHRKKNLLANRGRHARKRKIHFEITAKDLVWPEFCPVLGVRLDYLTRGKLIPNMPSIDRVDPRYGYTPANTRVISYRANAIKNAATPKELRMLLAYVQQVQNENCALNALESPTADPGCQSP